MNAYLKLILGMLITLAESQGAAMESQDDNETGSDDLIGEGLVYIGHFAQYLLDKSNGKAVTPPAIPKALHA